MPSRIERGDMLAEPNFVQGDGLERFDAVLANSQHSASINIFETSNPLLWCGQPTSFWANLPPANLVTSFFAGARSSRTWWMPGRSSETQ